MKRLNLDHDERSLKEFVRALPLQHEGIELELDGRIVCKIVPPLQCSEAEKKALVEERWQRIRQAQERNKGVPPRIIEREIREAVEAVRCKRS
jgi:hypothetical protein